MSTILQPTMRMGGRLFWAYAWRVFLMSILLAVVTGLLAVAIHFIFPPLGKVLNALVWLASFAITIPIFAIIFDKHYPHYSVKLVDNVTGEVMPRHWKNGLRPWWSYTWRCTVLGLLFFIPSTMLLMASFGPEIKLAKAQMQCRELMMAYKEQQTKGDSLAMQATETEFHNRQCPAVFAPRTDQQNAITKSKALGIKIGIFFGLIIGLAIQFKIFQIVLRKRYEKFHVQVTSNKEMMA